MAGDTDTKMAERWSIVNLVCPIWPKDRGQARRFSADALRPGFPSDAAAGGLVQVLVERLRDEHR
jgi:hypothetical protein